MDGRDAMSGPSSYYIQHRGIGGSGSGSQPGLHGLTPGIRSMHNPSASLPLQHSGSLAIGSGFQVETPSSLSPHGVNVGGAAGAGAGQGEPGKRKRGRPRKYGPDGTMALALSPLSSPPTGSGLGSASGAASVSGLGSGSGSAAQMQRRGRGRPPGTGRKQQLASLGEWVAGSAGMGFTPHIITIAEGEDIATKIMSFSQQGPRAVCILSANGSVSTATLCQPSGSGSGGMVTYEGRFEILCLSGSYLLTDNDGSHSRIGGLTISLSGPDGRVVGGGVGGLLRAASPVQVIVGSFIYGGSKTKNKAKAGQESGHESEPPVGDGLQISPASTVLNQSLNPSLVMGGWTGSRPVDSRNTTHIDINLTRG